MEPGVWPGRTGWPHEPELDLMEEPRVRTALAWEERIPMWSDARDALDARYFRDMIRHAVRMSGYAWALDGNLTEATEWRDSAVLAYWSWLTCLPGMFAAGVENTNFAMAMAGGSQAIMTAIKTNQWGTYDIGSYPAPGADLEASIQVGLCRGDKPVVTASARRLQVILNDPNCDPITARLFTGIPELALAVVGEYDPAQACQVRMDNKVTRMRRERSTSGANPVEYFDFNALGIIAVGVRAGIWFPDINPYTPLGFIHRTITDRTTLHP